MTDLVCASLILSVIESVIHTVCAEGNMHSKYENKDDTIVRPLVGRNQARLQVLHGECPLTAHACGQRVYVTLYPTTGATCVYVTARESNLPACG